MQAAMQEFAREGYDAASTNTIVQAAGISKGLLFHYFGSKKALFLALYDRAIGIFVPEFFERMRFTDSDIIERWRQLTRLKLEMVRKYGSLYDFCLVCLKEQNPALRRELDKRDAGIMAESFGRIYDGIDLGLFRKGLDPQKALDVVTLTVLGYSNRLLEEFKENPGRAPDYDAIIADFETYLDFLKTALYEPETQRGGSSCECD